MINSKIIVGKDSIKKLSFESYFKDLKSVFLIADLQGDISGAKSMVKKALGKDIKVTYFQLKASEYAEISSVNKCFEMVKQAQTDLIVCVGSEVALNIAKAVKYMLAKKVDKFEELSQGQNDTELIDNETAQKNIEIISVCIGTLNHQQILSGYFEIKDIANNVFYRFNKQVTIPCAVICDDKAMDKLSSINKLGIGLASLIMALVTITNETDEQKKLASLKAIEIVTKYDIDSSNLIVAEMYAGLDFINLNNNLLNEFILTAKSYTFEVYSLILLLAIKNSVKNIVDMLIVSDIELMGSVYGIESYCGDEKLWKDNFYNEIQKRLDSYFADKDIPKQLNEIGLNSAQIEDIFEELEGFYGQSETLSKLKDMVYSNY